MPIANCNTNTIVNDTTNWKKYTLQPLSARSSVYSSLSHLTAWENNRVTSCCFVYFAVFVISETFKYFV